MTVADLLAAELHRDGARPFLTWYDDATGDRVELSVATTVNWAAKIANFLVDEHDVEPGDAVGVAMPLHWQTAVVLLGTWTAGAQVRLGARDGLGFRDGELAMSPMGIELSRLVGGQPDEYVATLPVDPDLPALDVEQRSWTHRELAGAAVHAAHVHRLDRTTRVLSTWPFDSADGLDAGLLAPLAAGGSVVLVSHPDDARLPERLAAERVTHLATAGHALDPVPPPR